MGELASGSSKHIGCLTGNERPSGLKGVPDQDVAVAANLARADAGEMKVTS